MDVEVLSLGNCLERITSALPSLVRPWIWFVPNDTSQHMGSCRCSDFLSSSPKQRVRTCCATFTPSEGHVSTHTGQAGIVISQSDWISVFAELEYARTLLLELPVADARIDPELAEAANFLSRAQQSMVRGEYREAVGLCRDLLAEVGKALLRGPEAEFTDLRAKDKSQRLSLVRRALKVFTHPARHRDDVSTRFEWSRRDAVFCVTCVSALLNELNAPDALPAKTTVSALLQQPPSPYGAPETVPNRVEEL